jgi:hypothetical protein
MKSKRFAALAATAASPCETLRCLLVALLVLAGPMPAAARPSEVAVKAGFLTKFAGYLGWPAGARPTAGAPYRICVIGADPFGRVIEKAVRGQQIDRHPLQLRRLGDPDQAGGCHVAFVQGTASASTESILARLAAKPILTVTDARAGPQRGIIHFVVHQGRVRFHIDDAAAARSGLSISSRLLGVALSVRQRS